MHNNYYFLRQLTRQLYSRLHDTVISECFSQSKDELILRFERGRSSFHIRANLMPEVSCLSFTDDFQRARRNSVDLFGEITGRRVLNIRQFKNERSFALHLSDGLDLLFKMHANRTNIILFRDEVATGLFRNNLTADLNLSLGSLDREIDWSIDNFRSHIDNLKSIYFTFGKVVWRYLDDHGFGSRDEAGKWASIQEVLQQLNDPVYHVTLLDGKPTLTLLEIGAVQKILEDPVDAANEFFYSLSTRYAFAKEKAAVIKGLKARLEAGENYLAKTSQKLDEALLDNHYRVWADLIMANLHAIPPGSERIVLNNFYDDNRPQEIALKRDLTPQKSAELFYRKAKNQHIEIERLENSIARKKEEMKILTDKITEAEGLTDLKTVRALASALNPSVGKKEAGPLPYHEFEYNGFKVLVGRHAQANDTLTFRYGHKDDLWLHAKDVSGSHVLIKYQAGKNFPKDVIEYAASLAAYNSKRKTETLCPVIMTPKKFVRKRKGDPAGAVMVEREDVIMVEPWRPG
ncbi:MAG: NFACT RNA binding domain-containing protein [Bacteroidota bacterium]|nr:NFACT RNA binding domain-containing protein [Bacteroidota bacterium]